MSRTAGRASAEADELVLEVAGEMEGQLTELTAQLREITIGEVEAFRDPPMLDLLAASIRSNLEAFVHIVRYGVPLPEQATPPPAAEYARRLAQRGTDPASLLRSYRLGQEHALLWALDRIAALAPDRVVGLLASRRFVELSFRYVDAVSLRVVGEYERERVRWLSNSNSVRLAAIDTLLTGQVQDVNAAEQAIGYRLRQHHVAVVLWLEREGTPDQLRGLEQVLGELSTELGGAGPSLFLLQDRTAAWGWIPLGRGRGTAGAHRDEITSQLASLGAWVATGAPYPGPEGFRASHLEALSVQELVLAAPSARRLTAWTDPDVRPAALLRRDLEATKRLVAAELGELAADNPNAAALRETLRVFLAEQGSYSAAAARLFVHKNTVRYRVERAVDVRGRSIDDDRLDLELALVACEWLGPQVLQPESGSRESPR